jgi:hypothetical protein
MTKPEQLLVLLKVQGVAFACGVDGYMPKIKLSEQYICIVLMVYLFPVNLVSPK